MIPGSTFTWSPGKQTLVLSCRRGDTLWLAGNGFEFFLKSYIVTKIGLFSKFVFFSHAI
jgi:hypothetical protein